MGNAANRIFNVMRKSNTDTVSQLVYLKIKTINPLTFVVDDRLTLTEDFVKFPPGMDKNLLNIDDVLMAISLNSGQRYLVQQAGGGGGGTAHGIPAGGKAGQILKKISNANYDANWADASYEELINKVFNIDSKSTDIQYPSAKAVYKAIKDMAESKTGDTLPIGAVLEWYSDSIPVNWLLCNGQEVSRTDYPELFDLLGTTYGEGDGSTTFNLPDKQGLMTIGKKASDSDFDTLGKKGGTKTKTLTVNNLPSHNHTFTGTSHTHTLNGHTHSVGAHSHGLNSHTHSIPALSGTAASAGAHTHTGRTLSTVSGGGSNNGVRGWEYSYDATERITNSAGAHTHDVTTTASTSGKASGSTANSSAFNTGANSGNTSSTTAGGTVGNTGDGTEFDIMNPHIVANFIIKAHQSAGLVATVVDDLNTESGTDALSAKQGKRLKEMINNVPQTTVVDDLTSTSTTEALSANQGRILKEMMDEIPAGTTSIVDVTELPEINEDTQQQIVRYNGQLYYVKDNTWVCASREVIISPTEPTGNESIWIEDPDLEEPEIDEIKLLLGEIIYNNSTGTYEDIVFDKNIDLSKVKRIKIYYSNKVDSSVGIREIPIELGTTFAIDGMIKQSTDSYNFTTKYTLTTSGITVTDQCRFIRSYKDGSIGGATDSSANFVNIKKIVAFEI